MADGILDRLVHNAHRIEMRGDRESVCTGLPREGFIADGLRLAQEAPRTAFSSLPVRTLAQIISDMTTALQSLRAVCKVLRKPHLISLE